MASFGEVDTSSPGHDLLSRTGSRPLVWGERKESIYSTSSLRFGSFSLTRSYSVARTRGQSMSLLFVDPETEAAPPASPPGSGHAPLEKDIHASHLVCILHTDPCQMHSFK